MQQGNVSDGLDMQQESWLCQFRSEHVILNVFYAGIRRAQDTQKTKIRSR
jgi:hypothetical protein